MNVGSRLQERDVLETLKALIERFEQQEPAVRAFLPDTVDFDALKREAQNASGDLPLSGLFVGVKDIFHLEGYPTRAGSQLPPEALAGEEAQVVQTLKAAGALMLGKTVTTEFAYFAPGPTRNPRNLDHTPGGSSSGSAAAVAAGMAPAALGTQTIGSVIRPAAFCGVVGFKPTSGRLSTEGVIPLSPTLDHVGLFTADAESTRWLASHLLGVGGIAPARNPVLGIPAGPYLDSASSEAQAEFAHARAALEQAGYAIRTVEVFSNFAAIAADHNLILAAEAAKVHETWYERYAERYHPKTAELIEKGKRVSEDDLKRARRGPIELRLDLSQTMSENKIDLWISPSAPGTAPRGIESTGDPVMNLPWTHCGFPAINLPCGEDRNGLPYGLQLCADWNADEHLLHWAVAMESALEQSA